MVEKVIEGVWCVFGRDDFLPDSHMYIIGMPGSGDFTLVDAGLMEKGSYKIEQLDKCGVSTKQVKRIIMTHTHLDHIGCLPELLEAIPDAEVWAHREEALPLERGDEEIVMGSRLFESMIRGQYNMPPDYFRTDVHRKLEGGEDLSLGGISFQVLHLPGHSIGCIGLFNSEHKLFLSGDTIYADYAIGRYDLVSANGAQLKRSLEIIAGLGVEILLPCHNRIVKGGAGSMIDKTLQMWGPLLK